MNQINSKLVKKLFKLRTCHDGFYILFQSGFCKEDWKNIKEIEIHERMRANMWWLVVKFKLSLTVKYFKSSSRIRIYDGVQIFKRGKIISETFENPYTKLPLNIDYEYDKKGRQIKEFKNGNLFIEYVYDERGNLIEERFFDSVSGEVRIERNEFNELNQLVKEITPTLIIEYKYENGLMMEQKYSNGYLARFEYDERGNRTKVIDNDGIRETIYDKKGRVIKKDEGNLGYETYEYDERGNKISLTSFQRNGEELYTMKWFYDEKNNLVRFSHRGSNQDWVYDEEGNLVNCDKEFPIHPEHLQYKITAYHK